MAHYTFEKDPDYPCTVCGKDVPVNRDEVCKSCVDAGLDPNDPCRVCNDPRCDGCVPLDTPALDNSFHAHEMDV